MTIPLRAARVRFHLTRRQLISQMGIERRRAKRFKVNLPALWEDARRRERGTISDLSLSGCFMLTAREAAQGDFVRLAVELPGGPTIHIGGEVVYYSDEIGFAVRFKEAEATDKRRLAGFLKKKQAENPDA